MTDESKQVKVYPVQCPRCRANLLLGPGERVCPICDTFPLVFRERRKYPRVKINLPLELTVAHENVIGETKDISAGGAFIGSLKRLHTDDRFNMVIADIPHSERSLSVNAKVVQSNIYCLDDEKMTHGMGVGFTRISYRDRMLLTAVVEEQLRIVADIAAERRTQRNKEIFESFADFVDETIGRTDLDKVHKGQIIQEKASLLRLNTVK